MAYPTAAGQPSMSGTYIPKLYAATLLVALYNATVFGQIANTDYEGQIKNQGDEVIIRTLPTPVINDYVSGTPLSYATPAGDTVSLLINKGKYWATDNKDLDRLQSDLDYLPKWADHHASYLKNAIDVDVLSGIYASASADNSGQTAGKISNAYNLGYAANAVAPTDETILDYIIDAGTVLDEQNVPDERWMVLPAWTTNLIKKSDLKDASMTGDAQSTIRNGRIGKIDRFTIYQSNNVHSVTDTVQCWYAPFGHKMALTFATQMTKVETLRNPQDFGDLMRSLVVYGYKVVKPEALGMLYLKKPT